MTWALCAKVLQHADVPGQGGAHDDGPVLACAFLLNGSIWTADRDSSAPVSPPAR